MMNQIVNNIFQHRQTIYFLGALLTIVGSFLPWRCAGDIVWRCSAGIDFNFAAISLITFDGAMITVIVIIVGVVLLGKVELIQPWRSEFVVIWIISVLLYFLTRQSFVEDNGGLAIVILASLALWCKFRLPDFSRHSTKAAAMTVSTIVGLGGFHLISTALAQFAERHFIGGTSLENGLLAVFTGSVLMLAMHLWALSVHRVQHASR